ncbi:hypothetical protein [Helicobacter pylori]|uniref:hypothetical protein n=1 Tax=Helicobacter pylori TaxID=210 RepID=UPI000BE8770A|nr:hypothetical protein [Helicobacter pylori]PDX32811.1 hypothetical protein BB461_07105 [Helicobacter pylori]PDX42014.1 hypothetical protein BB474_05865 [Helicobacter pylori]RPF61404.1 hypothetical protein EGW00_07955 [Helicobacter pylori]
MCLRIEWFKPSFLKKGGDLNSNKKSLKLKIFKKTTALHPKKEILRYNVSAILTRMLVSVSKSHRKGLENYGKDIKT